MDTAAVFRLMNLGTANREAKDCWTVRIEPEDTSPRQFKLGPISYDHADDPLSHSDLFKIGHFIYNQLIRECTLQEYTANADLCGPMTLTLSLITPGEARDILRQLIYTGEDKGLVYLKHISTLGPSFSQRTNWYVFALFSSEAINRFLKERHPTSTETIHAFHHRNPTSEPK